VFLYLHRVNDLYGEGSNISREVSETCYCQVDFEVWTDPIFSDGLGQLINLVGDTLRCRTLGHRHSQSRVVISFSISVTYTDTTVPLY